jgi:hypothetical protein
MGAVAIGVPAGPPATRPDLDPEPYLVDR